ncbi:TPA: hypothetical protein WI183_000398 [Neisseria meningitidis]
MFFNPQSGISCVGNSRKVSDFVAVSVLSLTLREYSGLTKIRTRRRSRRQYK